MRKHQKAFTAAKADSNSDQPVPTFWAGVQTGHPALPKRFDLHHSSVSVGKLLACHMLFILEQFGIIVIYNIFSYL
jgi:hypothetical protein